MLQSLLAERVPVRDLPTIVETLSDYAGSTKDTDVMAEYVRMALKRQISELYKDNTGRINVFTIDPALEQQLSDSVQSTKQGLMLVCDPALSDAVIKAVGEQVIRMQNLGLTPVCICSPNVRLALRRLLEPTQRALAVVSYNEMLPNVDIVSLGMVKVQNDN